MNPKKIQGHHKVLWLEKTHVVPKDVTDKVQAYPSPKNARELQDFVGIWGFGGLLFSTWHSASKLYTSW